MAAIVVAIADAMVAMLDAATLAVPFAATRAYDRLTEREVLEAEGVVVSVIPSGLDARAFDLTPRDAFEWQITVQVEAQCDGTNAVTDPLIELVEGIAALFIGKLVTGTFAYCIGCEVRPPYDRDMLHRQGVFSAALMFTFRLTR